MAESTTPIQEGAGPELPARARGPGGPASIPTLASPRQLRPQTSPQLDGAGIIQRAAQLHPGGPQHVLLAPNGRILAYLVADRGVNLEAYLGRPMGIFGARTFRPEIHGDLIVVRGLVPVRLTK